MEIYYDAAIVWGETNPVIDENRYNSIVIEETLPKFKREPSSGEFLEVELDEISFGGSASTENVKKIVKEAFASVGHIATGFGQAKGLIPTVNEKHITVKHKDQRHALEVSTIHSWEKLIQTIGRKIQIPQPIKLLYTMEGDEPVLVTDVKALRGGLLYYALTVNEDLPKKDTSKIGDAFFKALKTDEDMSDAQVEIAKEKLAGQGITFMQLMQTGDLAITDADLEKCGISQLGLRKAILAVIRRNQRVE